MYMHIGGAISTKCDIHIEDSVLVNNSAQLGEAIYVEHGSSVLIINSTFLNNFTICRTSECYGGVIFSIKSAVSISGSVFVNNEMRSSDKRILGGAVTFLSCEVAINLTSFKNNTAHYGGAVSLRNCQITLFKVHFISNRALYDGGAVFIEDNSHFHDLRNAYINNSAVEAGGAIWINNSVLHLFGGFLINNMAKFQGGVLFAFNSSLILTGDNVFIRNKGNLGILVLSGSTGHFFGVLSARYNHGSIAVFNSKIKINAVADESNNNNIIPVELYPGGGITSILSTVVLIGSVNVFQNHVVNGGGILSIASTIIITNIGYFIYNFAESGGGICLYHSKLILKGSIFLCNNHATSRGGGIHSINSKVVIQEPHWPGNTCYFFVASNFAELGGGICLETGSRIYSTSLLIVILHFANNSANKGGAIYIADDTNVGACGGKQGNNVGISNGECFYQPAGMFDEDGPLPNLKDHFSFSNNSAAVSGAILFGGLSDRCTINNHILYSEQPEFIDFVVNETSSDAVRVYVCVIIEKLQ